MTRSKPIFLFCLLGLFLSGCVSPHIPPAPTRGNAAEVQLAEAANSVNQSLITLESIRKAEHPQFRKKLPSPESFHMPQLASIDWTGPIGPIVKRIAKASDFKLRVLGNPPSIPVMIIIHARNLTLGEILQNIDFQAGTKADIQVHAKQRVIELRYARG